MDRFELTEDGVILPNKYGEYVLYCDYKEAIDKMKDCSSCQLNVGHCRICFDSKGFNIDNYANWKLKGD